jgi:hypothetical protein
LQRGDGWVDTHIARFALFVLLLSPFPLIGQEIILKGHITDRQGNALPGAPTKITSRSKDADSATATSGPGGSFEIKPTAGDADITVNAPGFRAVPRTIRILPAGNPEIVIGMGEISAQTENVSVTADVSELDVLTS